MVDKYKANGEISDSDALELKYEMYSRRNAGDFFDDDEEKINIASLNELLKQIREQHQKETVAELKKTIDKIANLKAQEIIDAKIAARKKAKYAEIRFAIGYVVLFTFSLSVAIASIIHLIVDWNSTLPWVLLILEIFGILIFSIIPATRKLWKIKPSITNSMIKAYKKEKQKLFSKIQDKYTI